MGREERPPTPDTRFVGSCPAKRSSLAEGEPQRRVQGGAPSSSRRCRSLDALPAHKSSASAEQPQRRVYESVSAVSPVMTCQARCLARASSCSIIHLRPPSSRRGACCSSEHGFLLRQRPSRSGELHDTWTRQLSLMLAEGTHLWSSRPFHREHASPKGQSLLALLGGPLYGCSLRHARHAQSRECPPWLRRARRRRR